MRSILLLCVAVSLVGCAGLAPERRLDQAVVTESGAVAGTGTEIRAFRGIPYAKAPVGALRWKPPQAAPAWSGVHDGSRFGPDCMQPNEYPELRGAGMSEDCLSVNVWTPAKTDRERLPVFVWIYGGGFTYGSGSHPSYDGEALARRGIVVVNFNYRMGLFGFMAHPQLSAESSTRASGNYALMDQIAALQWIQLNIKAFGGDPSRVTVAGQSAGAISISSLITSDKARGLFHQAILQSVGVMRPMSDLATAEQFGLTVGPDISALRSIPAADLVKRLKDVSPPSREVTSSRGIGTIIDGDIVPRDDRTAYARGLHAHIPIIVGTVTNEGAGIARSLGLKTVAELQAYVARNFVGHEKAAQQAYEPRQDNEVTRVLSDLVADTQYQYGTREMLRAVAPREARLYRYVFSQRRNGEAAEPIHGAELQYPFENLQALHRNRQRPFNAIDQNVAREMTDAWARFTKTGDPNGGSLPPWPRYGIGSERYMEFGATIGSGELKASPRLDLIREYYAKQKP
jgi:para-nitrobenzyl esterase